MYIHAQRLRWEDLRSLGFASISGTYDAVGTAFEHPIRLIRFVNLTDVDLLISTDGTNDKDIVPAGGFVLYDISTNKTDASSGFFIDQGGIIYVKGTPTLGTFYVAALYASSN